MGYTCKDCCLKHLAAALVLLNEPITKISAAYILGNLTEAQNQITGFNPETANAIRDYRLELIPHGLDVIKTDASVESLETLIATTEASGASEQPTRQINQPVKDCGCKKNK